MGIYSRQSATRPTNTSFDISRPCIGSYFVNIHYVDRRTSYGDAGEAHAFAVQLTATNGSRSMAVSQYHPTEGEIRGDSGLTGSEEEQHEEGTKRLARYHVELIGKDREKGREALGYLSAIMTLIKLKGWE